MAVDDRLALLSETEEELEEESPLDLDFEEELELMPIADLEMTPTRCPADEPYTVRGFGRYSDDIRLLPDQQKNKLATIALEISKMASGRPDRGMSELPPAAQVLVVGHADLDAARESHEPGFLQFISEKRAAAVRSYLCSRVGTSLIFRIDWFEIGLGARALAVSNPRTEAERKCNRRVEITLSPQGTPQLDDKQRGSAHINFTGPGTFSEYYSIALQGTSGQYDKPQLAEKRAREIAEKVVRFMEQRGQEINTVCGKFFPGFVPEFKNALQGTASKFSDPDIVINKASEIAEHAHFGSQLMSRKLQWKYASLPQPMGKDCEVDGKVLGGPINRALCRSHGHILDTATRMVIARDLDEYKKLPR
jgi:hypothetical protein